MSKKSITVIALYSFVLVVAIAVILFVDNQSKDQVRAPITEPQATSMVQAYYPELKIYPKISTLKSGTDWLVAFSDKTTAKCFKVTSDGVIYKTGENVINTTTALSFDYATCQFR